MPWSPTKSGNADLTLDTVIVDNVCLDNPELRNAPREPYLLITVASHAKSAVARILGCTKAMKKSLTSRRIQYSPADADLNAFVLEYYRARCGGKDARIVIPQMFSNRVN